MPAGSSAGFSAKGWVRFATVTAATRYPIVRWFGGTGAPDTQLYYNVAVGAWRYLYQDATGFRNTHSDAWTPSTATTYFIVVTHDYSAETVKFYVNGTLLSTEDVSVNGVPVVHAAGSSASVGRAASDYWDGTLDEVALYNGVLTPTQILALYNAGSGAAGPQLVTPATASLIVTKYQPTVTTPQTFTPTTASLTATKYAPTVRLPILATPTTKALTVTRYEPTVRLHQLVTPAKSHPDGYQVRPDGHNAHSGGTGHQGTRANTVRAGCHCRKRAIGYPDDCRNPADEVRAGSQRDRSPGGCPPSGHADSYEVCPNGQRHGARGCHPGCQIADSRAAGAHRRPHRPCRGDRAQGDADDHPLCAIARADQRRSRHPDYQEPDALGAHPDRHGHGQRRVCPNDEGRDHHQVCPKCPNADPGNACHQGTHHNALRATGQNAAPGNAGKKSLALTAYTADRQLPCPGNAGQGNADDDALCANAGSAADDHGSTKEPRSSRPTRPRLGWHTRFTPITASLTLASFAPVISTTFNAVVRPEYGELTDHRIPAHPRHQWAPGDRSRNRRSGHHAIPANGGTALDHPAPGPHLRLRHRGNGRLGRGRNRKRGCYCTQRGRRYRRAHFRA